MNYVIRSIRADEWPAAKELRLAALQDPIAHLAFLETYNEVLAQPDSFWEGRAARVCEGAESGQQIIAEGQDGRWVGTLTVLLEEPGTTDWAGYPVERKQGHVVGVFVRPEERGSGLIEVLVDAGLEWAWGRDAERVRLIVHEENGRAQRLYRKVGFVPTGLVVPLSARPDERELEFAVERP
ncbi:GNAT family N-acetyltransferase [Streptomyces actuosus]|uniref:GNAT family N-acetyltransferase n=1 Tax=Streptomyces actuosus TaxID=1885 RepID=A0ABS2VPY6_STRAS|nr:GNAT family N-acetyltransferase [Streptomyces actuosus]MBN0045168.1 GNAT family N-acetyltransferase [Streptomyces actuosus]